MDAEPRPETRGTTTPPTTTTPTATPDTPAAGAPPVHALAAEDALALLDSDARGLEPAEAAARLARFGPNRVLAGRRVSAWRILADQFRGAIFWLLGAAAALSLLLGETAEAGAIVVVLLVNGAIGFTTELRAVKSMAALRKLTRSRATVRRGGRDARVDAAELVPGDIAVLGAGDMVPADLRLVAADDLHVDESLLTGESMPVAKSTPAVRPGTPLAERSPMAFRGTAITRGAGLGLVTATGAGTELAAIARMVEEAEDERSPLELRLDRLGNLIAIGAIVGIVLLAAAGIAMGRDPVDTIKTAVALAVAAVPEGLPIVATLALARGMWRMAAQNALINRLAAVETLGSATVLMTDKTGTLTENRMAVGRVVTADGAVWEPGEAAPPAAVLGILETAVLCTEVRDGADGPIGDPMEVALIEAAERAGLSRAELLGRRPLVASRPFDPLTRMMTTVHEGPAGRVLAVKGAPEALLERAGTRLGSHGREPLDAAARERLSGLVEAAAGEGLRMLAVATGRPPGSGDGGDDGGALTLLGFIGLIDPPRHDAAGAVEALARAGIRVVMVTGDHPSTARAIAGRIGLTDGRAEATVCDPARLRSATGPERRHLARSAVFARFEPRSKLDLVRLYRAEGEVVAMTGDGVNDAPALKEADIGVAMGGRGTQVAAEAADVILRDDRLGSIVAAVHQGRVIYGNIVLFVRYLFACNLSEILVIAAAIAAVLPMPLLPLQILFLNLVTDVFPAIALGVGEGPAGVMEQRPRRRSEPLMDGAAWGAILVEGGLLTAAVLGVFLWVLGRPGDTVAEANTAAFLTIALAQLWHVFAMHDRSESVFASQVTRNRAVWAALLCSGALVGAAVLLAPLAEALRLVRPDAGIAAVALGASLLPLAVLEAGRALCRRR